MPFIDYDHDDFPPRLLPAYGRRLDVTWDEILWASITVGRPDIYHVLQHGESSLYEALFRWSMIRMSLEQQGSRVPRFARTAAFKQMDPTEKGAVNYFLGLVMCKLFAAKLLDAPWTLHLDIWRNSLNVAALSGRSRPDMVAQSASSSRWYAFECKGRASVPGEPEKAYFNRGLAEEGLIPAGALVRAIRIQSGVLVVRKAENEALESIEV